MEQRETKLIDKIRTALADPKAPWYGSDLVPWVADLIEELIRLRAENERLKAALELVAAEANGWARTADKYKDEVKQLRGELAGAHAKLREFMVDRKGKP